jgi:hypothetical protein
MHTRSPGSKSGVLSGFPGLRHLLGRLERARGVGMGRKFITMGM